MRVYYRCNKAISTGITQGCFVWVAPRKISMNFSVGQINNFLNTSDQKPGFSDFSWVILTLSKPLFGLHFWGGLWPRMRSRSQPTCTSRDDVGWPKGFWTSENCCTYTWCPLIVAGSAKISCLLATWVVGAYHRWHSISKRGLLGCLGHFDLRGLPGCNSWDDTFMCCSSEYKQPEAWL